MDELRPELRINEANPLTVGMEVRSMSLDRELRCRRPYLSHLSLRSVPSPISPVSL